MPSIPDSSIESDFSVVEQMSCVFEPIYKQTKHHANSSSSSKHSSDFPCMLNGMRLYCGEENMNIEQYISSPLTRLNLKLELLDDGRLLI